MSVHSLCMLRGFRANLHATRPTLPLTKFQPSRPVSTTRPSRPLTTRLRNAVYGTSLLLLTVFTFLYTTDTRSSIHQWLIPRLLRTLTPDPEDTHTLGAHLLKAFYAVCLHPRERAFFTSEPDIRTKLWDFDMDSPLSISAGLDKKAEMPDALFALGASVVEVGGCTPLPQEGNPKPRVFRVESQEGLINRYGLNSLGADDMARRLRERVRRFARSHGFGINAEAERKILDGDARVPPGSLAKGKLLMVQVAKNKDTDETDIDAVRRDYVYCVERLAKYADVLVVNVSSPNTPGLRTLQNVEPLSKILEGVVEAAKGCERRTPPRVMVKVSPDEDQDSQIEGIVEAVWRSGVDGVIVGNTTNRRNDLESDVPLTVRDQQLLEQIGGYSGPQMYRRTLALVKKYNHLLRQGSPNAVNGEKGEKVIFATGGIINGRQVKEIIEAGASVAQVYTAMVYGGSGTITRMKKELRNGLLENITE